MTAVVENKLQKIYDREGRNTSSRDPKLMNARVFLGNFPAEGMERKEVEEIFSVFGKVLGISLHKTYGFVQYDNDENANAAVNEWHGKVFKGKKLDVNIATKRRKEGGPDGHMQHNREGEGGYPHGGRSDRGHGGRRMTDERFDYLEREKRIDRPRWPPPRRSPSPGRLEFEMRMRHLEMDRRGGPRFRDDYDPYFDNFHRPSRDPCPRPREEPFPRPREEPFPRPREEPFPRSRDDPYERYDGERMPRDFPPRHAPPRERLREPISDSVLDHRDPFHSPPEDRREPLPIGRSAFPSSARSEPRATEKKREPLGMQIIVVNKQQKEYANHVRSRFSELGINVELLHLSPTVSLSNALETAAESGLLYAVIISNQNEMHRSVTLTILHGRNPQEHKNMPLDDALGLVDRDFERYYIDVREGHVVPHQQHHSKNDITALLTKVASGDQLRPDQIDVVISTLQKQKETNSSGIGSSLTGRMGHHLSNMQLLGAESKESIQNQQADLQAKILSLLGSSAVVPSGNSSQGSTRGPNSHSSQMAGSQYWSYGSKW